MGLASVPITDAQSFVRMLSGEMVAQGDSTLPGRIGILDMVCTEGMAHWTANAADLWTL